MTPQTLLYRQVHPNFCPNKELSSQAFFPFPKDDGKLSVYDGDLISAENAYKHYSAVVGHLSCGVWGVLESEVLAVGLTAKADPLVNFASHALIDFDALDDKACRKLAKLLKAHAVSRGCLHRAP